MENQLLQEKLGKLTDRLLYSSESEFPIEVLNWGCKNPGEIESMLGEFPVPLDKISVNTFFEEYIRIQEMSGDPELKKIAERYQKLLSFLVANFSDITVWRSGKKRIGIYVILVSGDSPVLVLKTTSIET